MASCIMRSPTATFKLNLGLLKMQFQHSISLKSASFNPLFCSTISQLQPHQDEIGIMCEPCNGTGWLLCDFCKGQKTNVKSPTNRIYRRCPSCKAVGYILCTKCKVFKCVTFPDYSDGKELSF